jgi:exopolysaccharide biosynthesis polyprenyl glycosylphosphotransferase
MSFLGPSDPPAQVAPPIVRPGGGAVITNRWARLSLRLSERKMLLYAGDLSMITAALLVTLTARMQQPFGWQTIAGHPGWFALLIAIWVACAPLLNAYDLRAAADVATGVAASAATSAIVCLIYLFTPYITPPLLTSRLTAFTFVGLAIAFTAVWRAAYAGLLVQPSFRHRAIIVGAGWAGRTVVDALAVHAATEYDLAGFIDDDPARRDERVAGLPVVGTSLDLVDLVRARGVSEVIVAVTRHQTLAARLVQALLTCHELGVQITMMQTVYERLTGRIPVEHAGNNLDIVLPTERDSNRVYLLAKRAADITIGLVGSLIVLIILPLAALAIRIESSGPILYRQVRVGRGGRTFTLFKLRTMVQHAEPNGPQWAKETDDRVTQVGRVLRRLHLDELPQAINLLRGEMSFIGPRPERPEFVGELETVIPFYRARHAMRPGVTGWAQVNYRYGRSVEDALIKLQYDLYYVKHASLPLDAVILVRTLSLLLTLRYRP